ncbi:MAG: hypothetical protein ABII00_00015 [Elusimicrobiota bacterium]
MGKATSVERLVSSMSPGQKASARARLSELEDNLADPAQLEEIAYGYLLLRSPADAGRVAAFLKKLQPKNPGGHALSAQAYYQGGDYERATEEAAAALELNPRDPVSLALLRLTKDRRKRSGADAAGKALPSHEINSAAPQERPAEVRSALTRLPVLPAPPVRTPGPAGYHSPGAEKPGPWSRVGGALNALRGLHTRKMTQDDEARKLEETAKTLSATPAGKRLVQDLGGWERIRQEVKFLYGVMPSESTDAYARPLSGWERKRLGKRYALVLSGALAREPSEVAVPILGHELSHVLDYTRGHTEHGLQIPGELAAHRTQIYVYQEIKAALSPRRLKQLAANRKWQYQRFIAELWEDRLRERFRDKEQFMERFPDDVRSEMAKDAYEDFENRRVRPGSPHLDYHIADLYKALTDERDIADLVKERSGKKSYTQADRARDKRVLEERKEMLRRMKDRDQQYRQRHGFLIPAEAR